MARRFSRDAALASRRGFNTILRREKADALATAPADDRAEIRNQVYRLTGRAWERIEEGLRQIERGEVVANGDAMIRQLRRLLAELEGGK